MSANTRVEIAPVVDAVLTTMARERNMSKPALVREALGILQTLRLHTAAGYTAGLVKDREKLDIVLAAPL